MTRKAKRGSSDKKKWEDMINKSVHTSDDIDIGDIEGMSRDFIIVKRGYINEHYYYIPMTKVEGWDGEVLWLKVKEDDIKSKYERKIKPDPSRYYLKDISAYSATFPQLKTIPPKYKRPVRKAASIPPDGHKKGKYGCALCEKLFRSQEQLSKHVESNH